MPGYLGIKPEDWVRKSLSFIGDTSIHLRIRQKKSAADGGEVAAHIIVNGTNGDITFEQGATTGAANTVTGDNPQVGATAGVINLSDLVDNTYHALKIAINATEDWEAWLEGALPDDAVDASGTGNFIVQSDLDCTTAAGAAVLGDISQAKFTCAGMTFQGPKTKVHKHDGQVLHELLQTKGKATYSGAGTYKAFSCDDVAGTSTEILDIGAGATGVESAYPTDSGINVPVASVKDGRLVVKLSAVTTFTVADLFILGQSYAFGPGIRAANLESAQ